MFFISIYPFLSVLNIVACDISLTKLAGVPDFTYPYWVFRKTNPILANGFPVISSIFFIFILLYGTPGSVTSAYPVASKSVP